MQNINKIINGKQYAENLLKEIFPLTNKYSEKFLRNPCLAVILVGENSASQIYVKNKILTAEKNNISHRSLAFKQFLGYLHAVNKI